MSLTSHASIISSADAARHNLGGSEVVMSLRGEQTGGTLAAIECAVPAGGHGPTLHYHAHTDDLFSVLEGTLALTVDGDERQATAGSSVFIPRGVAHRFANASGETVRFLSIVSPAGFERYFDAVAEALAANGEVFDPKLIATIGASFDSISVG